MFRKKLILLLACAIGMAVHAKQIITGVVTDRSTKSTLSGVNAELLRLPDSLRVEGVQSNSDGMFMFYKADTSSHYAVKISLPFYKTTVASVPFGKTGMINSMGAIEMEPSTFNLKEITVNGTKMNVTEKADRTIYSIPEGVQKTSSDGVDVLRKLPTVQVDYLNEDISVNGRTNIRIEVDGITRDKGYLKRLHPSQISKMEIVTNPSGKYDSEIDAVINVVTNPAMRFGLKGMLNLGAFPIAENSNIGIVNGSLDYGLEKISYYVSANGIYQKIGIQNNMSRTSGADLLSQKGLTDMTAWVGNANAGFIYDPDEKNDLTFNIAYNNTTMNNDGQTTNNALTGGIQSMMKTINSTKNTSAGLTSSLFYKHSFDKQKQHVFESEVNYYNSLGNKVNSDFQTEYYNPLDSVLLYRAPSQAESSATNVQNLYGQSNYSLPIDSLRTINVGLNANYNHYNTNNSSTITTPGDMDYKDLRVGGFAEYSRTFGWGNIRLGTRFENSSVSFGAGKDQTYRSLLPYLNGLYRFNTDNSIKLSYSRRVIRPTATQLNPFVSVVDSQTISKGNIALRPAYRDNFQLTYQWRIPVGKATFNISPQMYYEYQTELIQNVIAQNPQTRVFESMPINISNGNEYGGSLSLNSQVGQILFNSNVRYSFYHVDSYQNPHDNLIQIVSRNQQGWNGNIFMMTPTPLKLQFFAMLYWTGPVLNGQVETRTSAIHLLGLSKQFKNNSSLRLISYNPFSTNFYESTSTISSPSMRQVQKSILPKSFGFMVMYSYSFKLGQSIERERKTVDKTEQNSNLINLPINY